MGRRNMRDLTGHEGEGIDPMDPLVVSTADLALALNAWVTAFNRDHDLQPLSPTTQSSGFSGMGAQDRMPPGFGGAHYLAHWSGVTDRTVQRILRAESQFTSLGLADKLLSAAGMTDVLHTTVVIVPNPRWTRERWEKWHELATEGCGDLSDDPSSDGGTP